MFILSVQIWLFVYQLESNLLTVLTVYCNCSDCVFFAVLLVSGISALVFYDIALVGILQKQQQQQQHGGICNTDAVLSTIWRYVQHHMGLLPLLMQQQIVGGWYTQVYCHLRRIHYFCWPELCNNATLFLQWLSAHFLKQHLTY